MNEVERTINALKNFRAVATRFDKRAYVYHGTVASIRLWLWLWLCQYPQGKAQLDAGPSIDELTHDVEVAVVAGCLLNEVEDHPAEVHVAAVTDGALGR
jgi:hypothetical protein